MTGELDSGTGSHGYWEGIHLSNGLSESLGIDSVFLPDDLWTKSG